MPSFKLKPEHIKIMTDLNFRISILIDSKDRYRPAIDIKRPFGNSGPTTNVCEIMGWHCDEESGEYAAEDIEKAEMLIIELPVALQKKLTKMQVENVFIFQLIIKIIFHIYSF